MKDDRCNYILPPFLICHLFLLLFVFPFSQTKREMGEELREAAFALAKATYAAGEFKSQIIESVRRPGITLKLSSDNVAGVKLPVFTINHDSSVDGEKSPIGIYPIIFYNHHLGRYFIRCLSHLITANET